MLGLLTLLLIGLPLLVGVAGQPASPKATPAPASPDTTMPHVEDTANVILLEAVTLDVTRDGQPRQHIQTDWGVLRQAEGILDVGPLEADFIAEDGQGGRATCGNGRIWLEPTEEHGENDMLLEGGVRFETSQGWIILTPMMYYDWDDGRVLGEQGFVKQLALDPGFIVGRGDRFILDFNLEDGAIESWTEYGEPLILEKTDTPGIIP